MAYVITSDGIRMPYVEYIEMIVSERIWILYLSKGESYMDFSLFFVFAKQTLPNMKGSECYVIYCYWRNYSLYRPEH